MGGTESIPWLVNRYEAGCLNLSTTDIWDYIVLGCGAGLCTVAWMPIAYPLHCDNQKCLQALPNVP